LITRALCFSAVVLAVGFSAAPAFAAAPTAAPVLATSSCSAPTLSQAFLSAGDTHFYTPAPGQSIGGFLGTGWRFSGGANVVSTQLADGSNGQVLDLPPRSQAVSPYICVQSDYSTARMMVRSLHGTANLSFRVSYYGSNTWTNPRRTGVINANSSSWIVSNPVNLEPAKTSGWQILRLTLVPTGGAGDIQLYDINLDPYSKG
jgi:hypothetical protein